ncbi:metal ABC transporter permease [Marinicrinis lubricantis]|uniref:Metal ABC transporter permease n=1 Tax=Marinicrinis lubricantis TaxID=2086470 RepID=A0ABW1IRW7_9BACL
MDIIYEPFFQRALIGGGLIGLMAPLIGILLVLRRLAMIGDTLAHVSIAGVALGVLINWYPLATGILFAVAAAFIIEKLRKTYKTYAELSIAIIMSGGVALASILFTVGKGYNINVQSYFFGSIFTMDQTDLSTILIVTIVVLGLVSFLLKELFLLTFDEDAAAVNGLPVRWMNIVLTVLTALVISSAIKVVGVLLVSALLTIPAASGLALGKSFKHTVIVSVIISEAAVIAGLMAAGLYNIAPGGSIVLLLIGILVTILFFKKGFRV